MISCDASMTPNTPTSPAVPIPAPVAVQASPKPTVAIGPTMALAITAGNSTSGFLRTLGICSILVPSPWDMTPLTPLSLKLATAKPIICAAQPTTAAPPAKPPSPIAIQIAALEVGSVNKIPTTTAMTIPMSSGCNSVAA